MAVAFGVLVALLVVFSIALWWSIIEIVGLR